MREKSFSTIIRADDPLVRDHQVHGVRIMPGVTFLDLIYRLALAAGFKSQELELRKILFIEPIAVSKDFDRKLVLRLSRLGTHWMVAAQSQRWSKGRAVEAAWQENASAELHLNTDTTEFETKLLEPSPHLEGRDLQHIYSSMQSVGIHHGEFMRCSGTAWLAGDGVHAQLNASRVASSLVDHFYILPSLLDTATGLSSFAPYAAARFADQPCVPIYIDRFRAVARFGRSCRVFLPIPASRKTAAADFSRDDRLDFFDSNGKFLARLEGLAFKKIRSADALHRLTHEEARPDPSIEFSETSEPEGEVIGNTGNGIRAALRGIVAALLKKEASDVADDEGFYESGLESSHLLEMVRQLEKLCGREFYPTLLFEYPSIARLEEYLAREVGEGEIWDVTATRQPSKRTLVGPSASIRSAVESLPAKSELRDAIAIIGMAGRYPKARNLEEFWENLKAGRDCIEEIPSVRWDHSQYPGCYAKWGGFIDDYDKFDPLFFNLSPREAEMMDPQERIFLETVWAAMEDSGYTRQRLKRKLAEQNGKAGVFVGVMWGGYQLYGAEELLNGNSVAPTSGYWSLANRVSYLFDFQGPSMAVDTACSSSLTAIHLACQSIQSGECQVAIAGGVNLTLHPSKYVLLCQLKMASTDGRCRSFGADGDGYVPGEGVGAVLLKSLERAETDGDRIYGVIRSTAINHGGRSNGYSVPNPTAQAELIASALQKGGVEASTIGFLEAHGTGTALGDPIEITALTKAYQSGAVPKQSCPIGSLKS
ncbi:MAG: baeL, partial [Verrucomicrobiales bacterium]|nr:baeL [Verrucomicrobiales bacterium]